MIKSVIETLESVSKEQKSEFLVMILGTLAASLLGNMLAGKIFICFGTKLFQLVRIFNATLSFN